MMKKVGSRRKEFISKAGKKKKEKEMRENVRNSLDRRNKECC